MSVSSRTRCAGVAIALVLLAGCPVLAQLRVGDNLALNSSATVSAGYSGSYGNEVDSSHGLGVGFAGTVSGFYYNPSFLSFNIDPYFNQSRSNSNSASVTNASGVTVSTGIFSGSHFPGSVNYTSAFDSTGNYGLPGLAAFNTRGNSQSFGVNWSAFVPAYPSLTVGYQKGNSNYSLYGTDEDGNSNFHSIYLNSSYKLAGFGLGAGFSTGASEARIPQVFTGGTGATSTSDSKSYTFSASHTLPLHGTFSSNFTRSDLNSDYLGYRFNGTIDSVNTSAAIAPTAKLHVSVSAGYTDNLSGSIYQATIPGSPTLLQSSGSSSPTLNTVSGSPQGTQLQQSSSGWDLLSNANYSFAPNFQAQGGVERRTQVYGGESFGSTTYSGGLVYTRAILGGFLGSSVSIIDSTIDKTNQNLLGFNINTNYNRRIGAWQVGGYFNYAQNVQTLLVTYMTSYYNFSGNVSRKLGRRLFWNVSASAGRSGLTAVPGSSSSGESFGTGIGTGRVNFAASYSKSNGNSLASGGGLNTTPLPGVVPASLLVMYGGTSYSFTASGSPLRKLSASATYVKSRSDLSNLGAASWNQYEQENVNLQYQLRQIGLTGGYTRLVQGFSVSPTAPANTSSFYIGVYRWFNFF